MVNTREIVLDSLIEILEKHQYSHYVIKQVLDKYGYLEKRDRSFIKKVTEGTVERAIELDYVIDCFSKVKTKKMKPFIRSLMRMSVYQILYMDKTMDAAVCNEAVKLASKRGFQSLKGFVNGVTRNIVRNKETIPYPKKGENLLLYLTVTYSMPEWIVSMWLSAYGEEKTEQILKGLLDKRPLIIRVDENLKASDKEALLREFKDKAIDLVAVSEATDNKDLAAALPYAYIVKNPDRVETLPGFSKGQIMIQDAGSMMITEFAQIKKDYRILDVCAAPGGKALHGALKLAGTGFVSARDISEKKTELVMENIARSGLKNISFKVWDATLLDKEEIEKADLVIADLPCSGLGVIGRKADIKYRLKEQDIAEIAKLQRQILGVVCSYVKPGGKLMYSTCTLTREENEENADWFEKEHPFTKIDEKTLYPEESGVTDGFYMALFEKAL